MASNAPTSSLARAAIAYAGRLGWDVFPLGVRSKVPLISERNYHL